MMMVLDYAVTEAKRGVKERREEMVSYVIIRMYEREIEGQICSLRLRKRVLPELIPEQETGQAGMKQWAAETGSPAPASCLLCVCSARGSYPRSPSGEQLERWLHAIGPACTWA